MKDKDTDPLRFRRRGAIHPEIRFPMIILDDIEAPKPNFPSQQALKKFIQEGIESGEIQQHISKSNKTSITIYKENYGQAGRGTNRPNSLLDE